MAKPKRRTRTRIRTAAGSAQELYAKRLDALVENPTVVLPQGWEQVKRLSKLQAQLTRMAEKGPNFVDKRDRSIRGAVARAFALAERDDYPRLADAKVANQRRFFLVSGQIPTMVHMAVQNHDDPRCLIYAYQDLAKNSDWEFFATKDALQVGRAPPQAFLEALQAHRQGEPLDASGAEPNADYQMVFQSGQVLKLKARKGVNPTGFLQLHYRGKSQRKPVELQRLDGTPFERETVAKFRGGLIDEVQLVRNG